LQKYNLDEHLVLYTTSKPGILRYLDELHEVIVVPMEIRLKKLVIGLGICSEAEIFASSMEFKVFQSSKMRMGRNHRVKKRLDKSEVKGQLKDELSIITHDFSDRHKEIYRKVKKTEAANRPANPILVAQWKDTIRADLAACLYFATYLSPLNQASQDFVDLV